MHQGPVHRALMFKALHSRDGCSRIFFRILESEWTVYAGPVPPAVRCCGPGIREMRAAGFAGGVGAVFCAAGFGGGWRQRSWEQTAMDGPIEQSPGPSGPGLFVLAPPVAFPLSLINFLYRAVKI